MIVTDHHHIGK